MVVTPDPEGDATPDRGQAFTLEAVVAALVLLASVAFALQLTAVTPLSASTSNQHIEGQLGAVADGLLEGARTNGTLRPALLSWNESRGAFHGAGPKGYYTDTSAPFSFVALLERTFTDRGVASNVNLWYVTADGDREVQRLIYVGTPTDHAVRAVAVVTLYDDDVLTDGGGSPTGTTLNESVTFYAKEDAAPNSRVYTVVVVEVVAWRM